MSFGRPSRNYCTLALGLALLLTCAFAGLAAELDYGSVRNDESHVSTSHFQPLLPLCFEPDATGLSYIARGADYVFAIEPTSIQLALRNGESDLRRVLRFDLLHANRHALLQGADPLPAKINYLIGNEPAHWRANVPLHQRVRAQQVYPGIDVAYYGNGAKLEYDFEIAPQADPTAIALRFSGVDSATIDSTGNLVLRSGSEEILQPAPVIYQLIDGQRQPVSGGYQLGSENSVTFALGR